MTEPKNLQPVLLIDDDRELTAMLSEYLALEGFTVECANRGDTGVEQALSREFAAIVLDVMLPGLNGFEALKTIRQESLVPVIMLTARGEDIDRILGLELGADDYLPKPFNPRELVARLRAIMRRQTSAARQPCSSEFSCRSLRLLPGARRAEVHGSALSLTSTEFTILEMLISAAGTVVDKNTLSEGALGRPLTAYDRSLDMHISHLRRKLAQQDPDLVIHTVRGLGYQLENP